MAATRILPSSRWVQFIRVFLAALYLSHTNPNISQAPQGFLFIDPSPIIYLIRLPSQRLRVNLSLFLLHPVARTIFLRYPALRPF